MYSKDLFLSQLRKKSVFVLESAQISSEEKHPFICMGSMGETLITFVCCTTQFEKRKAFIKKKKLPQETLVWIKPDSNNKLHQESYVDCNGYILYKKAELEDKYNNGEIEWVGEISDTHLEQLLIGLISSPLIEKDIKKFFQELLDELYRSA